MIRAISSVCLVLILAGCMNRSTSSSSNPLKVARDYVKGWTAMGMYLPPQEQISFFAKNLQEVSGILAEALTDKDENVRQRAAYVIENLGSKAAILEPSVASQIEKNRVVSFGSTCMAQYVEWA